MMAGGDANQHAVTLWTLLAGLFAAAGGLSGPLVWLAKFALVRYFRKKDAAAQRKQADSERFRAGKRRRDAHPRRKSQKRRLH